MGSTRMGGATAGDAERVLSLAKSQKDGGSGAANGNAGTGKPAGGAEGGDTIFKNAPPEGHAKKVSEVLGEIVWLMSQSPIHKQFYISDLEWFVMTPVLLQQFRIFYASDRPVGVLLWAFVTDELERRLAQGVTRLRPQDWKSGDKLWVVEAIAPFGGPEEMIKDLKANVFPTREVRYVAMTTEGKKDVRGV